MNYFYQLARWIGDGLRRQQGVQISAPASGGETASPVTFDTAMQLSAVWACVKLLAETLASLPFTIYEKTATGRVVNTTHPLAVLFAGRVNRYQNRIEFFETVLLNLVVHGNAYCLIQRVGERIVGLLPIMSAQVQTRLLADGSVVHEYSHEGGVTVLAAESVWHLKLMGNGIIGLSPLAHQRNTLGIAQAAEGAVTKIYRNGAKPSGVLTIDKLLSKEQRDQIRANFSSLTTGTDDRLMVLELGAKFEPVAMSPQDIELLSSRKFQLAEICRWYGVPSVMVNDNNGTSTWGSGIAEIVAGFYKITLRPMSEKVELSMLVNLFKPGEAARYEVEFDFEGLLRSDIKSRFEAYRTGIQAGMLKPNEARRLEWLPDAVGGDQLYIQGASVPITQAGRVPVAGGNNGT